MRVPKALERGGATPPFPSILILSVLIHGAVAEGINTKKRIPIAFVAIFGAWKKRTKLVRTNIAQKSQICYNESIKKPLAATCG